MNRPVDWKAFEYKFSTDPRPAFEGLAYILFCHEFKQTYGIFRYYNQPISKHSPQTQPMAIKSDSRPNTMTQELRCHPKNRT